MEACTVPIVPGGRASRTRSCPRHGSPQGASAQKRKHARASGAGLCRLRDALERLARELLVLAFDREVAERDDAAEALVPIEHRDAADLLVAHERRGALHVVVLEAVEDADAHHLVDPA